MLRLSQPVTIPELYRPVVLAFLRDYWDSVVWELRNHFGVELPLDEMPHDDDDYLSLMVAESIAEMAAVAAGQTESLDRMEVYEGVQGLVEKLFGIPGQASYHIPQEFWESEFGGIVLAAFIWSQGDELITLTQAAEISGKSVSALSQLVDRKKLRAYPDMAEPNPQRRNRLLRSEVESLKK